MDLQLYICDNGSKRDKHGNITILAPALRQFRQTNWNTEFPKCAYSTTFRQGESQLLQRLKTEGRMTIQTTIKQQMQKDILKNYFFDNVAAFKSFVTQQSCLSKIGLIHIDEPLGLCAVALEPISAGEIVVYAGEISEDFDPVYGINASGSSWSSKPAFIDARNRGNIAKFIMHAPNREGILYARGTQKAFDNKTPIPTFDMQKTYISYIIQQDKETTISTLFANMQLNLVVVEGLLGYVITATRDIEKGELLCYPYEHGHFTRLGIEPILFETCITGEIQQIPKKRIKMPLIIRISTDREKILIAGYISGRKDANNEDTLLEQGFARVLSSQGSIWYQNGSVQIHPLMLSHGGIMPGLFTPIANADLIYKLNIAITDAGTSLLQEIISQNTEARREQPLLLASKVAEPTIDLQDKGSSSTSSQTLAIMQENILAFIGEEEKARSTISTEENTFFEGISKGTQDCLSHMNKINIAAIVIQTMSRTLLAGMLVVNKRIAAHEARIALLQTKLAEEYSLVKSLKNTYKKSPT